MSGGPDITRRYLSLRELLVCPTCGEEFWREDGCPCDDFSLVDMPDPEHDYYGVVGRIDVTYETFGGERRWASAERGPEGGWTPVRASSQPPYPRLTVIRGEAS